MQLKLSQLWNPSCSKCVAERNMKLNAMANVALSLRRNYLNWPWNKFQRIATHLIIDRCFLLYPITGRDVISFFVRSLLNDCYWRSSTLKTALRAQWKDHGLGWGVPVEVARPPPVLLHPRRGACSAGAADRRHSCLWGWHQQSGWTMLTSRVILTMMLYDILMR